MVREERSIASKQIELDGLVREAFSPDYEVSSGYRYLMGDTAMPDSEREAYYNITRTIPKAGLLGFLGFTQTYVSASISPADSSRDRLMTTFFDDWNRARPVRIKVNEPGLMDKSRKFAQEYENAFGANTRLVQNY
jgi:hypothetical protein